MLLQHLIFATVSIHNRTLFFEKWYIAAAFNLNYHFYMNTTSNQIHPSALTKVFAYPYWSTWMLLVISLIYVNNFEVLFPNYELVAFFLGVLAVNEKRKVGLINLILLFIISVLIVSFVTPYEGMGLRKLLIQIALLPLGIVVVFYLGRLIGNLLALKFRFLFQVFFILYTYMFFTFFIVAFFQDLIFIIPYFALFSFGYSYYLLSNSFKTKDIAKIFSVIPLIHTLLYILGGAFFFDISLPLFVAMLFGILGGWVLHRRHDLIGWLTVFILVFVLGAGGTSLVSLNTSNVVATSHKNEAIPNVPLSVRDSTLMLSDFKGKVLVLDFWHRQCGACFKKFPDFNTLSNRYKGNEDVQFFALNHPIGSDNYKKSMKIMESLAYDFEQLYLPSDTIAGTLGVQFYPTLLVISKDQTRYIMTQIELSPWVYNNTPGIIDQMLRE